MLYFFDFGPFSTQLNLSDSLRTLGTLIYFSAHIETSHLFCWKKQINGFYMKCNSGRKWVPQIYTCLKMTHHPNNWLSTSFSWVSKHSGMWLTDNNTRWWRPFSGPDGGPLPSLLIYNDNLSLKVISNTTKSTWPNLHVIKTCGWYDSNLSF